tara:strand:+ start:9982 stop:10716 length:735 start_codon:yes stop_codon:yes gene_type:complete
MTLSHENKIKYKRVLLKLSGEALMGQESFGYSPKVLDYLAEEIRSLNKLGIQLAIVVGAGNICRGRSLSKLGTDKIVADQMGMFATIMNGLMLKDALIKKSVNSEVLSALKVDGIAKRYDHNTAKGYLDSNVVVILSGGTGNPLVTTDSAASLRGIEIEADILLKATNVDGVYDKDPNIDKDAVKYDKISFDSVLEKQLKVMDLTSFCQCRDYDLPIIVFNINKKNALFNAVSGQSEGTLVYND